MRKLADKALKADAVAYIKHWVNCIAFHAPGAPIVFVGTCKDMVNSKTEHHQPISDLLGVTFLPHHKIIVYNQINLLWFFPIDNTTSGGDATIGELRQAIDKVVREQEYVDLEVPVSWLACYDYLRQEYNGKGNQPPKRLSLEQFVAVAKRFDIKIDVACDQMLQVLHEFGLLLHFPDPQLREVVILDPQWLLDTFSCVIRDFSLHITPTDKAAREHPEEWVMLRDRALLHLNLIPLLWNQHTEEERRACLQLMCKHHLAVELHRKTWSVHGDSIKTIYQISSILPFDLSGRHANDLTDTLSSEFQAKLPHYFASAKLLSDDDDQTAVFYFAFYIKMICDDVDVTVHALEQSALLPEGLFARLLCHLVQEEQFASSSSQRLSRTAAKIRFGNASVSLNIVPHIGAIRVAVSPNLALRIACRLKDMLKSIIQHQFPVLQCDVLLPFDDIHLVFLDRIQRAAEQARTLEVNSVLFDPSVKYAAFMRYRGLLDNYHCMISYRQQANKQFARRLHDTLENCILKDGQPMRIFFDEFGLVKGCQFVNHFCLALSRALVALPIVSLQAITDMEKALEVKRLDYVLLEWSLMLILHDCGKLKRIFPIVLGDKTFEEFCAKVGLLNLDAVSEPTHRMLEEFVTHQLNLPGPITQRTASEVVFELLNKFYGLHCFDSSAADQEQIGHMTQGHAQTVQEVVVESMAITTAVTELPTSTPMVAIASSKVCECVCEYVCVCVCVFVCLYVCVVCVCVCVCVVCWCMRLIE